MNYRLLGRSGIRVSEIALGTMTFGTTWGWGANKEESKKIFDTYCNAGGNFIDTANRYTEGESEQYVGEFIASDRDHFVLATKYSLFDRLDDPNFSGNHRKNLMRSVESSLKRLNTSHIDLLWLHAWDFTTAADEVMKALDNLVTSGKVHAIGISDTPAWVVAKANTIAQYTGWSAFVALQAEYSLIQRTPERDLIPMAKDFGMIFTPWAPLAGGALSGKYLKGETGRIAENSKRRNESSNHIAEHLIQLAQQTGHTPAQLALRWTMQKDFVSIPIIGSRKAEQIKESLQATDIVLSDDALEKLDELSKIELGFPHDFLASKEVKQVLFGGTFDQIKP